jgi:iron(III) transport system permease protein
MTWGATRIAASDRPRLIEGKTLAIGGTVALVAWLMLVPVVFLLRQSFLTAETVTAPAQFAFENCRLACAGAETLHLFGNSVAFAIGSASLAFVVGAFLAWVNGRDSVSVPVE